MDYGILMEFINNIGVPAVVLGFAFWFINKETDAHRTEREKLEQTHKEEVDKLSAVIDKQSDVINNNTLVMQQLCDKLDELGKE